MKILPVVTVPAFVCAEDKEKDKTDLNFFFTHDRPSDVPFRAGPFFWREDTENSEG